MIKKLLPVLLLTIVLISMPVCVSANVSAMEASLDGNIENHTMLADSHVRYQRFGFGEVHGVNESNIMETVIRYSMSVNLTFMTMFVFTLLLMGGIFIVLIAEGVRVAALQTPDGAIETEETPRLLSRKQVKAAIKNSTVTPSKHVFDAVMAQINAADADDVKTRLS